MDSPYLFRLIIFVPPGIQLLLQSVQFSLVNLYSIISIFFSFLSVTIKSAIFNRKFARFSLTCATEECNPINKHRYKTGHVET